MKENKILKINGTTLEKEQLEKHLEKIASNHNIIAKSQKNTYPIPHLIENFRTIEQVYELLNEHLKLGINFQILGISFFFTLHIFLLINFIIKIFHNV